MNSSTRQRPLSPHLQVYRWLITSTTSILHRLSGIVLSGGLLLLFCWLMILSYSPNSYDEFAKFLSSFTGMALLFGWSVALFYHLANGIRHLFFDMGIGFDIKTATKSGYFVFVVTAILTAITWGSI